MPIAHDLDIPCVISCDFSSDTADDIPDCVPDGTPVVSTSSVRLCKPPVSLEACEPREKRETMNHMTAGSASRQIGYNATIPPTVGSAMTSLL